MADEQEVRREVSMKAGAPAKRSVLLKRVDALEGQLVCLQPIDHEIGEKAISTTRMAIDDEPSGRGMSLPLPDRATTPTDDSSSRGSSPLVRLSSAPARSYDSDNYDSGAGGPAIVGPGGEPAHWIVVQFNNGAQAPVKVKCGASPDLDLLVKAVYPDGTSDKVVILPVPSTLNGLVTADMESVLEKVPDALKSLVTSKTAEGTRARYTRLYKTLAARVPALKALTSSEGGDESPFSTGRGGRFGSFGSLPSSMDVDQWRRGSVDGSGGGR